MKNCLFLKTKFNTLEPASPEADDFMAKIKIGDGVSVSVKAARNYKFLKKAFKLLHLAFDIWEPAELIHNGFPVHKNIETFREEITILAGHCEQVFSLTGDSFTLKAKSWSYDKCEEEDFELLYKGILKVTWDYVFRGMNYSSQDEIDFIVNELLRFE